MIIGDPKIFALESQLSEVYPELSSRALGYFLIHVDGQSYGVRDPEATLLACSFDAVGERLSNAGMHHAAFAEAPAPQIITTFLAAMYPSQEELSDNGNVEAYQRFAAIIHKNKIQWTPDGDEAFDDGSFVLQFDIGSSVRIVAFTRGHDGHVRASTIKDTTLNANEFYGVLMRWREAFETEWSARLKIRELH